MKKRHFRECSGVVCWKRGGGGANTAHYPYLTYLPSHLPPLPCVCGIDQEAHSSGSGYFDMSLTIHRRVTYRGDQRCSVSRFIAACGCGESSIEATAGGLCTLVCLGREDQDLSGSWFPLGMMRLSPGHVFGLAISIWVFEVLDEQSFV